ncbi:MAG TPA: hypothetical protein VMA72_01320 [Streptosporangiaceae bacterium]|nr:hypothetical protein [Streptosporangiaceae bacterium]
MGITPTGNYAGLIARSFRHARIVYAGAGATLDLPDHSSLYLTDFGVVVNTPDRSPNKFIPWASILEIVECDPPGLATDDGQMHD